MKKLSMIVLALVSMLVFAGCSFQPAMMLGLRKLSSEEAKAICFDEYEYKKPTKKILIEIVEKKYGLKAQNVEYSKTEEANKANLEVYVLTYKGDIYVVKLKDVDKNYPRLYESIRAEDKGVVDDCPVSWDDVMNEIHMEMWRKGQ